MNLAQCAETYHRRRFGGKYQSDEEYRNDLYQRFLEAIPQDLDGGFRQSLKQGKLRFANEYSLRKRLQEITNKLSTLPISFINTDEAQARFISKVCDTRNYLTHYDPQLQDKAAKGIELFELKEKLKILLGICLLEETGFSFESIRDIITTDQRFKRMFRFIVR